MIIKCENCGAEIDENEPKCPYCGALNEIGGEREYMEKLDDIREDMEELPEEVDHETKKELKRSVKLIRNAALITIGVILILVGIEFGYNFIHEHFLFKQPSQKETMRWQSENFPILDEMYDAGDFDAIVELMDTLTDEDSVGTYALYDWKHIDIILDYRFYSDCMNLAEHISEVGYERESYYWMIYNGFYVLSDRYVKMPDEDIVLLEGFRSEVTDTLKKVLKIDDAELKELLGRCYDDEARYLNYDATEKVIKQYLKENFE